ncbi:MAG TPA: phytanoyl-CoA dioxygenase family protein [Myxococcota bacterium]|nr:phytanoyl-CoA dioxygenase family protein [Myxococcota bacterium]
MSASSLARTDLPWIDRIAQSFEPHSFVGFHRRELPRLIERHGHLVARDLRGAPALAFRVEDGATFSWIASDGGVRIVEGDADAATLVELPEAIFSDFLHELLTASGATMTGRARVARGALPGWQRWEPAIQSLCHGRPIYGPEVRERLVDRAGRPLELHRSFEVGDPEDEMRAFFDTTGYLHIRSVFTREEVAFYGAEVERCRARTRPDDGDSWWSVNASGHEVITRINYLDRFSKPLLELAQDPRLARYARLAGSDLRVCDDRLDGPMVFIKNAHVVKGNGDLLWHVDDGIGGHPVMCPLIQAGIQLDRANAANGQLLLLAGSHRYAKHWIAWGAEGDLPVVALETEPGDLTLHYGDTMHSTPAPTADDAGRRALYYKFAKPRTFDWIPARCHYNDALFRRQQDGRVAARATTWESSAY